eukprot:scaffold32256_cov69-Phaeocystis_antarctica.AAC.1
MLRVHVRAPRSCWHTRAAGEASAPRLASGAHAPRNERCSESLASPAGLGHRGQARRRPERGPLRGAVGRPQGEAYEAKDAAGEEPSRGVARGGRLEQGRRCGHR